MSPIKNGVSFYDKKRNKILILGGWDERDTSDTIYEYCPIAEKCSYFGNLPHRIEGASIARVSDFLFIIGGFDSYGVSDKIMRLDLKSRQVTVLEQKLGTPRENHAS